MMILTMTSIIKLLFDSKGYGVKKFTFYVLDLVCLTSLMSNSISRIRYHV